MLLQVLLNEEQRAMSQLRFMILLSLMVNPFFANSEGLSQPLDDAWSRVISSQASPANAISCRHWFLGYVEGKTDVAPPDFWSRSIVKFRFEMQKVGRGELPVFYFLEEVVESPYHVTGSLIECPLDTTINVGEELVRIQVDDFTIELTDRDLVNDIKSAGGLTTAISEDYLYLALRTDGDSCRLACINLESKERVWASTIEPLLHPRFLSGQESRFVELKLRENKVYVFGVSNASAYIAKLDAKSGKQQWLFTTDNSLNPFQAIE
jgi:hypothetical protein